MARLQTSVAAIQRAAIIGKFLEQMGMQQRPKTETLACLSKQRQGLSVQCCIRRKVWQKTF